MKAYDIAGRRTGSGVVQTEYAIRLGWNVETVRDVEQGRVDITEDQYRTMSGKLDELIAEREKAKEVIAA